MRFSFRRHFGGFECQKRRFKEIVQSRFVFYRGSVYIYSSTPYAGELKGKFNVILDYSNTNNYGDIKEENAVSEEFEIIKKYVLEYVGYFVKRYEFNGGLLERSFQELLLRFIFFETEYQNVLYRGPNLFLQIFKDQAIAAKYYFNFVALNYCIIVAKSISEKIVGQPLYRFKDNFFRVRRELSQIGTV